MISKEELKAALQKHAKDEPPAWMREEDKVLFYLDHFSLNKGGLDPNVS